MLITNVDRTRRRQNVQQTLPLPATNVVLTCIVIGAFSVTGAGASEPYRRMTTLSDLSQQARVEMNHTDLGQFFHPKFVPGPDGKLGLSVLEFYHPSGYDTVPEYKFGLATMPPDQPRRTEIHWFQSWRAIDNGCQVNPIVAPQVLFSRDGQSTYLLNTHAGSLATSASPYEGSCMVAATMKQPSAQTILDLLLTGVADSLSLQRVATSPEWRNNFPEMGPGELIGASTGASESSYATSMERCATGKGVSLRVINNSTGIERPLFEHLELRALDEPANAYLQRAFYPRAYDGGYAITGWVLDQDSGQGDYERARGAVISASQANLAGDSTAPPHLIRINHENLPGEHDASQVVRGSADGKNFVGLLLRSRQDLPGWVQTGLFIAKRTSNTSQQLTLQRLSNPQVPGTQREYQSCQPQGLTSNGRRLISICKDSLEASTYALVVHREQPDGSYAVEKIIHPKTPAHPGANNRFFLAREQMEVEITGIDWRSAAITPDGRMVAATVSVRPMVEVPFEHNCFWQCSGAAIFH